MDRKLVRAHHLSDPSSFFPYLHLSIVRLNVFYLKIKNVQECAKRRHAESIKNWTSPDGDAPPMDDAANTFLRSMFLRRAIYRRYCDIRGQS